MASISHDTKTGRRTIQVKCADGKRRSIRLGKVSKRHAESVKLKLEELAASIRMGHPPKEDTQVWLGSIDEEMYSKLAAIGLVALRARVGTLAQWLDQYLDEQASELKPESIRKLRQTRAKLVAYFGESVPLSKITTEHAAGWRQSLKKQKLSEATIKIHGGNVKTMMGEAVRRDLIVKDPFRYLKSGPTPRETLRYVTPDEIERVIAACPDHQWRALFGLARYAGLRVPSETHQITTDDVDWNLARLTVRSPKTERYAGKAVRVVPILPPLMPLLQARVGECEEGGRLVLISGQGAVRRRVVKIWEDAQVEPWPNLWQTLRSSCEQDMAMYLPEYAVNKWMGHSRQVSRRHYTSSVPDELYDRAAGREREAVQNPVQHLRAQGRIGLQAEKSAETAGSPNPAICNELQRHTGRCK